MSDKPIICSCGDVNCRNYVREIRTKRLGENHGEYMYLHNKDTDDEKLSQIRNLANSFKDKNFSEVLDALREQDKYRRYARKEGSLACWKERMITNDGLTANYNSIKSDKQKKRNYRCDQYYYQNEPFS